MLNIGKLMAVVGIATMALPAVAGSWPSIPPRKASANSTQPSASQPLMRVAATTQSVNGFEFIGGESGWQPAQHKYVWSAGRLAHSNECDHADRVVMAPMPAALESSRKLYPGG